MFNKGASPINACTTKIATTVNTQQMANNTRLVITDDPPVMRVSKGLWFLSEFHDPTSKLFQLP